MFKKIPYNQYNHNEIVKLGKAILGEDDLRKVSGLVLSLESNESLRQEEAMNFLLSLFVFKQKRPLFYLRNEIERRLKNTRSSVWFASMYIEFLVKFMKKDLIKKKLPLGKLLSFFGDEEIPQELKEKIYTYNRIFWATSKHEIGGYPDNEHLFSLEDAVICCLVTAKIANKILAISESARIYNNGDVLI